MGTDPIMYRSDLYKFIHPNLDIYKNYINYIFVQNDDLSLWFYNVIDNNIKGMYTKEFFKLENSSKSSFDEAQGIEPKTKIENPEVRASFEKLLQASF